MTMSVSGPGSFPRSSVATPDPQSTSMRTRSVSIRYPLAAWPGFGQAGLPPRTVRRSTWASDAHRVVAGVDVEDRAGHHLRHRAAQVEGGLAGVGRLDVLAQRRALLDDALHLLEAGDPGRGQRPHRPRRDGVHPDPGRPQLPGQVAHGALE